MEPAHLMFSIFLSLVDTVLVHSSQEGMFPAGHTRVFEYIQLMWDLGDALKILRFRDLCLEPLHIFLIHGLDCLILHRLELFAIILHHIHQALGSVSTGSQFVNHPSDVVADKPPVVVILSVELEHESQDVSQLNNLVLVFTLSEYFEASVLRQSNKRMRDPG